MTVPDEKLEFSAEDLGRLAAFMDGHPGHPLEAVRAWLESHSHDMNEFRRVANAVEVGYHEGC